MPIPDIEEEEEDQKEPEEAPKQQANKSNLTRWLSLATSIAGLTAIAILTFEMILGTIRFGTLLAYGIGTAMMVGLLMLMILGFKWAAEKFSPGMMRWAFWLIMSPLAFFYYLLVAWLVYVKFAQLLIHLMKSVLVNAP